MSNYFLARDGRRYGPYSSRYMQELARTGKLRTTDLVQRVGMTSWHPAGKVPGLVNLPAATRSSAEVTRRTVRAVLLVGLGLAVVFLALFAGGFFIFPQRSAEPTQAAEVGEAPAPQPTENPRKKDRPELLNREKVREVAAPHEPGRNPPAPRDDKLAYINDLAPDVVNGSSLQAFYAEHRDARNGRLVRNRDGSQELFWGNNILNHQAVFGGGRLVLHRWKLLEDDRKDAEERAEQPLKVLGNPISRSLPEEPEVVSCASWVHGAFMVRTAVVRGKAISGEGVFYSEVLVLNRTLLEALLSGTSSNQGPPTQTRAYWRGKPIPDWALPKP